MKRHFIVTAALFSFGLLGGWLWDRKPAEPAAKAEIRLSPRAVREANRRNSESPSEVAARLAGVRSAPNAAERLRAAIQLAWEIPVSELPQWYEKHAYSLKGAEVEAFFDITRRRWLDEEPEGLMDLALRRNWKSIDDLAAQWARRDPDRALAYLESRDETASGPRLVATLLPQLVETHPNEVFERLDGLFFENSHVLEQVLEKLAKHHPEKLTAAMASWPSSLANLAQNQLAAEGLRRDFPGELQRLMDLPDGKTRFMQLCRSSPGVADQFLKRLQDLSPEWVDAVAGLAFSLTHNNPERWLAADLEKAGASPENAEKLRLSALVYLSHRDPLKTLAQLEQLDVSAATYQAAFQSAVLSLAGNDPAAAAEWAARVPADQGVFGEKLRAALDEKLNPSGPETPPAHLISQALDLEMVRANPRQTLKAIQSLGEAERAAFFRDFSQLHGTEQAEISRSLLSNTAADLQPSIASRLIDAALAQPAPAIDPAEVSRYDRLPSTASRLAVDWVLDEPAAATRWLATLPAGETRQWALRNTASNWRLFDTPAAEAWLATLPPAERADVRQHLTENP